MRVLAKKKQGKAAKKKLEKLQRFHVYNLI